MLPNFLIVGGPRCGTTYLHHCLGEHPEVYMAALSYSGDINFFNPGSQVSAIRYYDRGITWYESLFEGRRHETAVGEKTAHYFADPEVPARISNYIPNAKIIVIIRNPAERAYSHFWYSRGKLPAGLGFREVCQSPEGRRLRILESGLYYQHLQRFLQFFSKDRIHIIVHDSLLRDTKVEFAKVLSFLGVDSTFVPRNLNHKINGAIGPGTNIYRLRLAGHYLKQKHRRIFKIIRKLPISGIDRYIGRSMSEISAKTSYPAMSPDERGWLDAFFETDTQMMGQYLSVDLLSMWNFRRPQVSS